MRLVKNAFSKNLVDSGTHVRSTVQSFSCIIPSLIGLNLLIQSKL